MLVAPVEVKDNSYTGAGSVITKDVPEGSLAVARSRQKNIEGWIQGRKKQGGQS
jgi:bifunctional UDP-N-acetylglucosamine pyrophosphorylase/glucosamine-1-phosphate N-acetyltransferase